MTACSPVVLLVDDDIIVRHHWLPRRDNRADHHSRACSPISSAGQGSYSFAPHLMGWLVFSQPDIDRLAQQVIGRPGQKGGLLY